MIPNTLRVITGAALCLAVAPLSLAQTPTDTPVVVRVQAHDAKFIGSGVGGMNVVVEDAATGALLASGRIEGGTGDTQRLIHQPIARDARRADDKTAAFVAHLRLEQPTRVRIRITGPLAQPQAAQDLSVTTWVVPGRPIEGDGIVLTLPGLIVTPAAPAVTAGRLSLTADVTLMCGCPITRDGPWNAADYEVGARVTAPDGKSSEIPLAFAGPANRFAGAASLATHGRHEVTLWAHDAKTGNTGAARLSVDLP